MSNVSRWVFPLAGWRPNPAVASILWCALGVLLVLGTVRIPTGRAPGEILIDMEMSKAGPVRFYWNAFLNVPPQVRILAGSRTTVRFRAPPETLFRLRFDPAVPDQEVRIYGVTVLSTKG